MSYKLEKPYTDRQRADFICEHQGMKYAEDDTAIYFLEDYEELQNEEVINISNTCEYHTKILRQQNTIRKAELTAQINEFDLKRIRAGFEPSIKNESTGETYLKYYTNQIIALREELNNL